MYPMNCVTGLSAGALLKANAPEIAITNASNGKTVLKILVFIIINLKIDDLLCYRFSIFP
jgi:hypothetical protein